MKVNYATPVRKTVFYKTLNCGDTFCDDSGDLNIKIDDTLSIFLDSDDKWHTITRFENEIICPVSATLNVEM